MSHRFLVVPNYNYQPVTLHRSWCPSMVAISPLTPASLGSTSLLFSLLCFFLTGAFAANDSQPISIFRSVHTFASLDTSNADYVNRGLTWNRQYARSSSTNQNCKRQVFTSLRPISRSRSPSTFLTTMGYACFLLSSAEQTDGRRILFGLDSAVLARASPMHLKSAIIRVSLISASTKGRRCWDGVTVTASSWTSTTALSDQ